MSRHIVAGTLGMAQYRQLARRHRPQDPDLLRAEVLRLANIGLRPRDISEALEISEPDVRNIIAGLA